MSTLLDTSTDPDDTTQTQDNQNPPSQRTAVARLMPGVGNTYLDSEFAQKLDSLEAFMEEQGIPITYLSAYRPQALQDYLRTSGTGITPAKDSLHSAGLAADLPMSTYTPEQRQAIVSAAKTLRLRWGGDFKSPGIDPNHFDLQPTNDHKSLINNFTPQVQRLRTFQ